MIKLVNFVKVLLLLIHLLVFLIDYHYV